jgi:hypothetical protein
LNASDCFPGVEIKGGVSYFLWDRDNEGLCKVVTNENNSVVSVSERLIKEDNCNVFIRYNEAIPILKKVKIKQEDTINKQISSQKPFGLRTFFQGKNSSFENAIKVYANQNIGYINLDDIPQNKHWINEHKVIVPRAIGSGDSKTDIIKPIYSEPGSCCTETYVVFGPYNSKKTAKNAISYIQTKFFHFLVTLQKNTMMASKQVYSFVPIQNFEESWTDEKLYAKYGLTEQEVSFIDSMIRPMDFSQNQNDDE